MAAAEWCVSILLLRGSSLCNAQSTSSNTCEYKLSHVILEIKLNLLLSHLGDAFTQSNVNTDTGL